MKSPNSTFVRFLIAGAVNTLFGFLIYGTAIWLGLDVWQALLAGILAGMVFNFITTGGYAFRDLSGRKYLRFCVAYVLIYFVNLTLVMWLKRWIPNTIVIQGVVTIPMAIGSYILMAKFVFQQSFKVQNGIETSMVNQNPDGKTKCPKNDSNPYR